jgi:hypothetical protein
VPETTPGTGGSTTTEIECTPGRQEACVCDDGSDGIHVCFDDGSGWGFCDCEPVPTGPCGDGVCSDEDDENCHTCTQDCGACAPCDIAPACGQELIPPSDPSYFPSLDVSMQVLTPVQKAARLMREIDQRSAGMRVLAAALDDEAQPDEHRLVTRLREIFAQYPAATERLRAVLRANGLPSLRSYRLANPVSRDEGVGYVSPRGLSTFAASARLPRSGAGAPGPITTRGDEFPLPMECGDPFLRIGVSEVRVHEDYDDVSNDEVYCLIQSEAQTGGEIRLTPMTPALDQGDNYLFSLESGVFWGQAGLRTPGSALMVTYDCLESDTDDGYANLLTAIGEAAVEIGGVIPGQYGWIVVACGVVAQIVGTAWAMDGDDQLLNIQQTIPEENDYELTNGVYWTIRKADDGGWLGSAFDWELVIKAWGCAEYGEL